MNIDMMKQSTSILQRDAVAVADVIAVMLQKEQTTYKSCDYLRKSGSSEQHGVDAPKVNEADRTKIVDWCYSVIDQCQFERETVAIAMEMVDRFLSKPSDLARRALQDRMRFQLLAVSALYVCIKTNERCMLSSKFFSIISCGQYSVEDIEVMEKRLLEGLSWQTSPPTCMQMAHHVLSLISKHVTIQKRTWATILDEVAFQAEHAVREYYFVTQRPSTVAMAAIFNAIETVREQDRQAILVALVFIMNGEFDSPEQLLAAKELLHRLVREDKEICRGH